MKKNDIRAVGFTLLFFLNKTLIVLPGGCLRDRGKLDEDGPKLNSLFGVPVPISEAVDDGCPKSKVAMSQGTPILWKKIN